MFDLKRFQHDTERKLAGDGHGQELAMALAEALVEQSNVRRGAGVSQELATRWQAIQKDATADDMHVQTELTDLSVAYAQQASMFAAGGSGVMSVAQKSDKYFIYDRGDQYRDEAKERAAGTPAAVGGLDVTTAQYACKRYAIGQPVDDELIANQTTGDPRLDALFNVTLWMMIKREKVWATNLFKTGIWTTDLDGVDSSPSSVQFQRWDQSGSDPRSDLTTNSTVIHELTGYWPNEFIVQPHVLVELMNHADVIDAFKYTTAGARPNMAGLAGALFGIEDLGGTPQIRIVGGVQNTANEGATDSFSYIGDKDGLLAYVERAPGLRKPSAYYTFSWEDAVFGTNAMGIRIKDFEVPLLSTPNFIEGEIFFDPKLVQADLGVYFDSAVN